jgi:molecular chaperone DnaJ
LCPQCLGEGNFKAVDGILNVALSCPTCEGKGRVPWIVCESCGGAGQVPAISVDIRVPAGVASNDEIVLKGLGAPGIGVGPPGNLIVRIKVLDNALFKRDGDNLIHKISIPVWDAALGCRRSIKGINGPPFAVQIPPGCANGRTLGIRGAGMPTKSGSRGDLRVVVEVAIPDASPGKGALHDLFTKMRDEMDDYTGNKVELPPARKSE